MISYEAALRLVLDNCRDFGTENVDLMRATGRVLAENIFADRDFPPYNRVMMDGVAISTKAFNEGIRSFRIIKVQAAGEVQASLDDTTGCIEVMTGAVLPENADAVVPYEQCTISGGFATVQINSVAPMQNVHLRGSDSKMGALLLSKYTTITAAMIGTMASVGKAIVAVRRLPKVAICSTGDELVEVTTQPASHQVRRSNVFMLASAILREGIHAEMVHLPDDPVQMTNAIAELRSTNDILLFSGAVSKGKFDYLPGVLHDLGMQQIFHSVAQRPGKPFLFGTFPDQTIVFGFPGNPVSTMVCYNQFFKPWLAGCLKRSSPRQFASLTTNVVFKPSLTQHLLVQVTNDGASHLATPVNGSTSGDLVTLTKADAIICLPSERENFFKGEVFELFPLS